MLQLSYIWQEICPMFAFGTMIRGISNYHVDVTCINNINSYTKYTELTPCVVFLKKKLYSIKKIKYKIDSWVFVRSPLYMYEMVFVQNGLCMEMYVKI